MSGFRLVSNPPESPPSRSINERSRVVAVHKLRAQIAILKAKPWRSTKGNTIPLFSDDPEPCGGFSLPTAPVAAQHYQIFKQIAVTPSGVLYFLRSPNNMDCSLERIVLSTGEHSVIRKLDRGLQRYCIDVGHGFIVIGSTGLEIYSEKDGALVTKVNSVTTLMNSVSFFTYKNEPRLLLCLNESETLSVYSVPQFKHLFTQRLSGSPVNHACFSANYEETPQRYLQWPLPQVPDVQQTVVMRVGDRAFTELTTITMSSYSQVSPDGRHFAVAEESHERGEGLYRLPTARVQLGLGSQESKLNSPDFARSVLFSPNGTCVWIRRRGQLVAVHPSAPEDEQHSCIPTAHRDFSGAYPFGGAICDPVTGDLYVGTELVGIIKYKAIGRPPSLQYLCLHTIRRSPALVAAALKVLPQDLRTQVAPPSKKELVSRAIAGAERLWAVYVAEAKRSKPWDLASENLLRAEEEAELLSGL